MTTTRDIKASWDTIVVGGKEKLERYAHRIDEGKLRERILADRYNRLVFDECRIAPLYLVGGYIRDMLRGEVNPDRDYACAGDYESIIRKIIAVTGGKLVRIGDSLSRIVLEDGVTIDFSPIINDIGDDLSRRDFTINSIAWSPGSGILDPNGGLRDLDRSTIRMIDRRNLEADPVRLLRAYRLSGGLCFRMDHDTRIAIRELSHKIVEAKSERITLEFFKILNLDTSAKIINMMASDGILSHFIPLNDEELEARLRVLSRLNGIFNALPLKRKNILDTVFSQNLSYSGMIRFEALLDGFSTNALAMSSRITKRLCAIQRGNRFLASGEWSHDDIFEAFKVMGDASVDYLILKGRIDMLSEYERYQNIIKRGLLTTSEVIEMGELSQGEKLGEGIKMLKKAEFNYRIKSRQEAIFLLRNILSNLT